MPKEVSINAYDNPERAMDYHTRTGFDPDRKATMLNVTLDCLIDLTNSKSSLLELGAGSGLFTKQIIEAKHFNNIYLTDGAENMLEIAEENVSTENADLHFHKLDFTEADWSDKFAGSNISAVTSSMALHHASNKQKLFNEDPIV